MCGIIGYIGDEQAAPILIDGLSKLEYRGYDSAGIAVRNKDNDIEVVKACGKLVVLSKKIEDDEKVNGCSGIGHTRWATHGVPSEINSHPHVSSDGEVALVHNGIIENYIEYKEKLIAEGYSFKSETDSEVVANMLSYYYKECNKNPEVTISKVMHLIDGSYAFGIMFKDYPDAVYVAKNKSPLVIGKASDGFYAASDVSALISHTRSIYYLEDKEMAVLKRDEAKFLDIDLTPLNKACEEILWDVETAEKGGYDFFMLKEIEEQPKAVNDTLGRYIQNGEISLESVGITDEQIRSLERIYIIACGSAYHVAEIAKYEIERVAKIPVETEVASEFRYRNRVLAKNSAVIIVSQSGETADSIAALNFAKDAGVPVYGIVNVVGSAIARASDGVMYTVAGPEKSVATTKAYSAQLICVYLLAIKFAFVRGEISKSEYKEYITEIATLPEKIKTCFEDKEKIQTFANSISDIKEAFFIGRGVDYALALEGSLKLKEISYVHSDAYAAGELKHGTISLIEDGTPVIGIMTQQDLLSKTASNLKEVKSRGAYVVGLSLCDKTEIDEIADFKLYVPQTLPMFTSSLAVVPLQLLAYYVAIAKGKDVDKPRNLAKSVTVE